MTLDQVLSELAAKGSPNTKILLTKHGAKEPFFGVKVADLKLLQKKIKGDQALALKLYATGNADAQYLAGLVAEGKKMTPAQLQSWAESANWGMIADFPVAWVASEHPDGFALALKWIDAPEENIARSGWKTLSALVAMVPDDQLPVKPFSALLDRVVKSMRTSPNAVRQAMNGFVIACGTYSATLAEKSIAIARKLGRVEVDVGDTDCKVPDAESYILKYRRGAAVAAKRKTVRC